MPPGLTIEVPADALEMAAAFLGYIEGTVLHPYRDSAGVWTIGTGLTSLDGKPVTAETPCITAGQNAAALEVAMQYSVRCIEQLLAVRQDAGCSAALVSFVFNVGRGGLISPAGIPTGVLRYLNGGNVPAAALALLAWNHAGGQVVAGLTDRRALERAIMLGQLDPRDQSALRHLHQQIIAARLSCARISPPIAAVQ